MTIEELKHHFDNYEDQFLKFKDVADKLSERADLHGFILLDKLCPDTKDIIGAAEHDQIWIDVDIDTLAQRATSEQVLDLVRCGVMYEEDTESLSMFT